MAAQNQAGDGIEALWSTIFMRRALPGAELANQALSAFCSNWKTPICRGRNKAPYLHSFAWQRCSSSGNGL